MAERAGRSTNVGSVGSRGHARTLSLTSERLARSADQLIGLGDGPMGPLPGMMNSV
jgi:hypothetical protein